MPLCLLFFFFFLASLRESIRSRGFTRTEEGVSLIALVKIVGPKGHHSWFFLLEQSLGYGLMVRCGCCRGSA
jgi:hypothetical protein